MLSQPGSTTNRASDSQAAANSMPGWTGTPFTVTRACGPKVT